MRDNKAFTSDRDFREFQYYGDDEFSERDYYVYQNSVKIFKDDGSFLYLISNHCHDYKSYQWEDGSSLAVDGGKDYLKRCNNFKKIGKKYFEEWNVTSNDSFDVIKNKLLWGTRGINGDQPLTWKPLNTLTDSHLKNILKTEIQINDMTEAVIKAILVERRYFK
jgi:hypothetical protein